MIEKARLQIPYFSLPNISIRYGVKKKATESETSIPAQVVNIFLKNCPITVAIFSPYYSYDISNNSSHHSYDQILNLCNKSVHIHRYLHHIEKKPSISYFSYYSSYLLLQYFKCVQMLYNLCYALIVFIPPLFILSDCRIIHEITLNNAKLDTIIKYLSKYNTYNSKGLISWSCLQSLHMKNWKSG